MKKIIFVLFFVITSYITAQGNIIIKIGDLNANSTGEILVPINVNNFSSIGAISWKVKYDSNVLEVIEAVNIHSELKEGYFSISSKEEIITISWFSLDAADIGDGKLLDLKFNYFGGNSSLDFIEPSKTSNLQGVLYSTSLQNGMILDDITDVKIEKSINYFQLKQNYPNPFNPETNIDFKILKNSFVRLDVFDLKGAKIQTLINGDLDSGSYSVGFLASNLSSGNYFYRLQAIPEDNSSAFIQLKKMTLLR